MVVIGILVGEFIFCVAAGVEAENETWVVKNVNSRKDLASLSMLGLLVEVVHRRKGEEGGSELAFQKCRMLR